MTEGLCVKRSVIGTYDPPENRVRYSLESQVPANWSDGCVIDPDGSRWMPQCTAYTMTQAMALGLELASELRVKIRLVRLDYA